MTEWRAPFFFHEPRDTSGLEWVCVFGHNARHYASKMLTPAI